MHFSGIDEIDFLLLPGLKPGAIHDPRASHQKSNTALPYHLFKEVVASVCYINSVVLFQLSYPVMSRNRSRTCAMELLL